MLILIFTCFHTEYLPGVTQMWVYGLSNICTFESQASKCQFLRKPGSPAPEGRLCIFRCLLHKVLKSCLQAQHTSWGQHTHSHARLCPLLSQVASGCLWPHWVLDLDPLCFTEPSTWLLCDEAYSQVHRVLFKRLRDWGAFELSWNFKNASCQFVSIS